MQKDLQEKKNEMDAHYKALLKIQMDHFSESGALSKCLDWVGIVASPLPWQGREAGHHEALCGLHED